jgi:hypothetical protein
LSNLRRSAGSYTLSRRCSRCCSACSSCSNTLRVSFQHHRPNRKPKAHHKKSRAKVPTHMNGRLGGLILQRFLH